MADKTTHFGLNLPLDTELADQTLLNENFSKLDEEVFRRGKAINGIEVNNDGDFILEEVPYARDIVTDQQQASSGEYLFRTTGGTASVSDGNAMLIGVHGRILHTGEAEETLNMTVHSEPREAQEGETPEGITATLNREVFIAKVENQATITVTLSYSNAWSENPTLYGVTVTGEPISGDYIIIQYVRADRGLITTSYPTLFKSTGWNLYNNSTGYARVHKYSNQYDFMAGGTYTELKFSETIDGDRIPITVTSNHFSIPSDGYVWVSGGNALTTYILMTWSDWTSGPQGGWKAYSETSIDLSGVMEDYFPYGLCKIGAIIDEINVRDKTIIRRIERVAYSEDTIAQLKQAGTAYEADQNYLYYVLTTPVTASIEIESTYVSNDHGLEIVESETDVAPFIQTLYGENLVDKLRTDIPNQISALSEEATSIENGLAIVANGNTHAAIASGQYVYVKSHSTLSAGMYTAKSTIAANAALSMSNLTAVSGGSLNATKQAINSLYTSYLSLRGIDSIRSIEANSDLDNYFTPGVWVCQSSSISSTILHKPDAVSGNFKLIVNYNTGNESGTGNWWGCQIIISNEYIYIRNHIQSAYGEWNALTTAMQYDDILSLISWDVPSASSSYFRRSGRFVDMCIVSDETISISNGTTLGTITAKSYRPWKFVLAQIFDYSSGKPLTGSAWIDPSNGNIKYYGNAITNTRVIFHITYMI